MIKIHGFPTLDIENGILRAWWVDPLVATISFGISVHVYWYFERRHGLSRQKDPFHDVGSLKMGDLRNSLSAYWIGIFVLKTFTPPREIPDGLPKDWLGLTYLIAEVFCGIIMYDALFFFVHWSMHECSWLRQFHRRHHFDPHNSLEATDVLRHSLVWHHTSN